MFSKFFRIIIMLFGVSTLFSGEIQPGSVLPGDPNADPNWPWYEFDETDQFNLYPITHPGGIGNRQLPWYANTGPAGNDFNNEMARDIYPEDGWVLFFRDFGTPSRPVKWPMIILYNKFTGVLRVFYYNTTFTELHSYGIVRLKKQEGSQPFSNLSFTDNEHYSLDDYDPEIELVHIGLLTYLEWAYADFNLVNYDPDLPNNAKIQITFDAVQESTFEAAGDISLIEQMGNEDSNVGGAQSASQYLNLGKSAYQIFKNTDDEMDKLERLTTLSTPTDEQREKYKDWGSKKDKWWAPYARNILDLGISQFIPAAAALVPFYDFIFPGQPNARKPLHLEGSISLSGSLTLQGEVNSLVIRLPGSTHSGVDNLPLYSEPLGIYSIQSKPHVSTDLRAFDLYGNANRDTWIYTMTVDEPIIMYINPAIQEHINNITFAIPQTESLITDHEIRFDVDQLSNDKFKYTSLGDVQVTKTITDERPNSLWYDSSLNIQFEINSQQGEDPLFLARSYDVVDFYAEPKIFTGGTFFDDVEIVGTIAGTIINGDIIIDGNSTLTIHQGVELEFLNNARIDIKEGSKLIMDPIQEALDAGLPPGAYVENWIDGENGYQQIILRGDNNKISGSNIGDIGLLFEGDNNVIEETSIRADNVPGIYLSSSNNNTISGCNIHSANTHGIRAYYSSMDINNTTIENNKYGLYAYRSNGSMSNSQILNNQYYGMRLYNSAFGSTSPTGRYFLNNEITGNGQYGVHLSYGGKLYLGHGVNQGRNKIKNNAKHEIYIEGYASTVFWASWSENSIYDHEYSNSSSNKYISLYTRSGNAEDVTVIDAQKNYWGSPTGPDPESNFQGLLNVDYSNFLTSEPVFNKANSSLKQVAGLTKRPMNLLSSKTIKTITSIKNSSAKIDRAQMLLNIKNDILSNVGHKSNANSLFTMHRILLDKWNEDHNLDIDYMSFLINFQESLRKKIATSRLTNFEYSNLETAMLLDIDYRMLTGDGKDLLNKINEYLEYAFSIDSKTELLALKLSVLIYQSKFQGAAETLTKIAKLNSTELIENSFAEILEMLNDNGQSLPGLDGSIRKVDLISSPEKFKLSQNFPNPFNPSTKFELSLPISGKVTISVYNTLGQRVSTLANSISYEAGVHSFTFDGSNLASGVYILHANAAGKNFTRKMILMK
jgi:parallel beta-helix repeat protein